VISVSISHSMVLVCLFGLRCHIRICSCVMLQAQGCFLWLSVSTQLRAMLVDTTSPSPTRAIVSAGGPSASTGKRGRPSRRVILRQDGDPILCALVAEPSGKWSFIGEGSSPERERILQQLASHTDAPVGQRAVVGIAVIRSWRFVHESFSSSHAHDLAMVAKASRPRQSQCRFLEHDVLDAVAIPEEAGAMILRAIETHGQLLSARLARQVLSDIDCQVEKRGAIEWVCDIVRGWADTFPGLIHSGLRAWGVWSPLAKGIASHDWGCDLSVIWQRQDPRGPFLRASVLPSDRSLAAFRKLDTVLEMPSRPVGASHVAVPIEQEEFLHQRGFIRTWTARSMIIALRFGAFLKRQRDLPDASEAGTACYCHFARQLPPTSLEKREDVRMPSQPSLCKGRIKLDIASMLARRSFCALRGRSFRCLGFDASPQRGGVEVFATLERAVLKSDIANLSDPSTAMWPRSVETRRCPLAALGQGRAALSDKAHAHANQVWLEYGGSIAAYMESNLDVRGVISDMGVECGIGDYVDISNDAFANPARPSKFRSMNDHLYPLALVVPGPQHAIDVVVQSCLESLTWWPEWSHSAKTLCQWSNASAHRERLAWLLGNDPSIASDANLGDLLRDLQNGCERFASWRWKTLHSATRDLRRLKRALQLTVGRAKSAGDLGISDKSATRRLIDTTNSDLFWDRTEVLHACIEPLSKFSSWLRGCACHEQERMRAERVQCCWAGCRAPELRDRLRTVREQLTTLRERATTLGGVGCRVQITITTILLGGLLTRFDWVDELPFLVWQVLRGWRASNLLFPNVVNVRLHAFMLPPPIRALNISLPCPKRKTHFGYIVLGNNR